MTETTTLKIPADRMEIAQANFAKLSKRAEKLGVTPATMVVGTLVEQCFRDEITGRERVYAYYPVTLTQAPVKLAGWTLVAALDHLDGGVLTRVVPDQTLPARYREAGPDCTHCQNKRQRNTTFVLQHEDGRYAQVGTSCLADFLGISPSQFVGAGVYLSALGGWAEEFMGGGGSGRSNREYLAGYLALVARYIEANGWVSRKVAKEDYSGRTQATSDAVNSLITVAEARTDSRESREARQFMATVAEKHQTLATDALAWVRAKHGDQTLSDYLYNLTVLTVGESFDRKYSGLVASLIPTFQRHLGQERERQQTKPSNFVGEVGKRMAVELEVLDIRSFEGDYGVRTLVSLVDPAGNRYKWWTGDSGLTVGEKFTGKATVKAHETYKDLKSTVLTRVTVAKTQEAVNG